MEKSNITKQAKSDIFKELYSIINFYIKKGAKPKALKKYYNNKKRFNELLDDIKYKASNLVKEDDEYKKLVRSVLNDMLDDFIAKEKDDSISNNKLKHIKEFNHFEINEGFSWILTLGAGFFFLKFLSGLFKHLRTRNMTPEEIDDKKERNNISMKFRILSYYLKDFLENGGKINFSENYLYYIFEIGDVTVKIDKKNKTIFWTNLVPDTKRIFKYKTSKRVEYDDIYNEHEYEYSDPISISDEDIDNLIFAVKNDIEEQNN